MSPHGESYSIRPARLEDAGAVADVCNSWALKTRGSLETNAEKQLASWQRSGFDIECDTRVAKHSSHGMIAYAALADAFRDYKRIRGSVYMHPDHRDSAVEDALLQWIEDRAKASVLRIPLGPRVTLSHLAMAQDETRRELLNARGYALVHHTIRMQLRLDNPPRSAGLPEEISIRVCDRSQDLPAISGVVQEAFREHWGFVERTLENDVARYERWLNEDPGIDPSLWHIAWQGDEAVGVCLGTANYSGDPNQAYIYTLGVRDNWRGRGVGRALLVQAVTAFHERGRLLVDLDVDIANITGALGLYESVGMRSIWQIDEYEKELRAASAA